MTAVRKILHLDLDAFFCAVEEQHNPDLAGKPFAVGGRPEERGVVASCSYAARQYGIHSAMPMAHALRLCRDLIIVPSRHGLYGEVSGRVMERARGVTPLVEQISIDEAFLDVSGRPEPAEQTARQLQALINEELGLPCSLGVASNKLVAKIANTVGKSRAQKGAPPNAIMIVPPGEEAAFLAPLPVRELWGVGPKTAERLAEQGIRTIGDLARCPETDLVRRFGKMGAELARRAQGVDDRPVETEHETKSISRETTFAQDTRDGEALRRTLRALSDSVGRRLRQAGLAGSTVKLKLRWADFTTLTRQATLDHLTDRDDEIFHAALRLFEQTWARGRPVRLIGVGISGLETPARQLSLWDAPQTDADRHLQQTLDLLRDRFGEQAVQRASDLIDDDNVL